MKHFDDSTKKIIKNVAALLVSAVVLISATIAWFSSGSNAGASAISGSMSSSQVSVKYYTRDVSGTYTYDTTNSTISGLTAATHAAFNDWEETSNINVPTLFPGEYKMFKITVRMNAAGTPVFSMSNFSCLLPSDADIAYDSIFINLIATDSSGTVLDSACGSMSDLMSGTGSDVRIAPLSQIGAQAVGSDLIYYLDIGIPGYDVNDTHDDLRMTGALIRIGTVGVGV